MVGTGLSLIVKDVEAIQVLPVSRACAALAGRDSFGQMMMRSTSSRLTWSLRRS